MNALFIAGIIFASAFGGAVIGGVLQGVLPEHHLQKQSRDIIIIAMGLIASMVALVLGLLIASATTEFSSQKAELEQLATDIILVDRTLEHYGPEADTCSRSVATYAGRLSESSLARQWNCHPGA